MIKHSLYEPGTSLRNFSLSLFLLLTTALISCQTQTPLSDPQVPAETIAQKKPLLPVSKGDTISNLLPLSKGDTIGSATLLSKGLPQSLSQVKGALNLPFAGQQLNLTVRDWDSQRQLAALLSDQDGSFVLDGAMAGQWLYLIAEGRVADSDKVAVFAAVIQPQQPLTQVSISLESTALAAVLLSLQQHKSALLESPDLAKVSAQVAALSISVLADMQQAPGQPLLNYVTTAAFERQLKVFEASGAHEE